MYRYARTRNRVHRVVIEGGRAFKVENCNLDDVGFLNLVDVIPEGTRCAWCWAGYVEPTPEQKAAESAENAKREEAIPPGAKPIPLVTSTRRMAAAVLAAALLAGASAGVLLSPDQAKAVDPNSAIEVLRQRFDDLLVQVRILDVDINSHTHESLGTAPPVIVVIPPAQPTPVPVDPVVDPSSDPAPDPSSMGLTGSPTSSPAGGTSSSTTVIVIQPPSATSQPGINPQSLPTSAPVPTPAPTPDPTPVPCFRPGVANGVGDRCKWPPDG